MGFIDRDLNRKLLIKANNDISEAVTLLTSYNYFNDDDDDVHIPAETSPFISPLASEQFEQQQQAVGRGKKNRRQKERKKKLRKR